jgi:hypothetical protein
MNLNRVNRHAEPIKPAPVAAMVKAAWANRPGRPGSF